MLLFFTAARIVFLGITLKTLEEGHAVLMREAYARFQGTFPPGFDREGVILGNQRADLPRKRPDGSISLLGMLEALFRAQVLTKYHHGMRQPWHHPVKSLPKVQLALYQRLLESLIEPHPAKASELLGGALHTLQDSYTPGHTERENNADPHSPMLYVSPSPSKEHPFISPRDTVYVDKGKNILTPAAEAAIIATLAALDLWAEVWPAQPEDVASIVAEFVNQFAPIRGQVFSPPERH